MIGAEIRVFGRVQGVAYRASAVQRGRELGLAGTARNRDDGSVELIVEGEDGAVASFVAWCHEGPALARVDEVAVTRRKARGLSGFSIVR